MPRAKTIEQLRKELQIKERKLATLKNRRKKALAQLKGIDRQIAGLGGKPAGTRKPKRAKKARRRRKAAKKAGRRRKVARKVTKRRKRATGKPLVAYIQSVLGKAEGGRRVKEVVAAVRKAGYKTASKDFYGIVAAALREDSRFKRLGRGVYGLAG